MLTNDIMTNTDNQNVLNQQNRTVHANTTMEEHDEPDAKPDTTIYATNSSTKIQ